MRRPLFVVALCMVIIAAIRLETGGLQRGRPGCISVQQLEAAGTLLVTGQVYQKDEESIYLKSVVLIESNAFGQSVEQSPVCENLICETEAAQEIPLGSTVTLSGVFSSYSQATNPGEFDAAVYYRTLDIGGKLKQVVICSQGDRYWPVREGLYHLKNVFKERLYHIFPEKEAAVMSALLLGDKKDLDSELKNLYKRNGILHILSISSLHITIIGMGVYKLLRKAGLPICPAAIAGSTLLILYGCMTGFSMSACRAIGMYLIRMLAEMVGRTYDMLTALGVLAAVMVVKNPYYLQNSGFILSFSSVLGIGVLYPALMLEKPISNKPITDSGKQQNSSKQQYSNNQQYGSRKQKSLWKSLCQSAMVSISITLATLPIQLWFYYEVPVYSVFLNLFVIPFMQPIMITGLLVLVPGLGFLGGIDYFILRGYEFFCGCFDSLPFHTWNPGCPKLWQIAAYYLILTGVAVLKNYKKNRKKEGQDRNQDKKRWAKVRKENPDWESYTQWYVGEAIGVFFISIAVLLLGIRSPMENRVTFLDVGQGDCILMQTASGQTYLFDCGSSNRSNIGKYVLLPYLKYNGIHAIDAVFLSHPDSDHVNGALELFGFSGENNITIKQLILPAIEEKAREEELKELVQAAGDAAQKNTVEVRYISAGDSWDCGRAVFTCLHPETGYSAENANAYSECFYVQFKENGHGTFRGSNHHNTEEEGWSLLLTGDVEGGGEAALLKELSVKNINGVTVLKAAHHGSRNSTTEELLLQISPSLTVISCGRKNRYGHPHAELLERLEASGTHILQTAQSGAIMINFRDGTVRAEYFSHSRQE